MDDYHAFTSTSGGSSSDGGNGGCGCSSGFWGIIVILFILYLIGKCG